MGSSSNLCFRSNLERQVLHSYSYIGKALTPQKGRPYNQVRPVYPACVSTHIKRVLTNYNLAPCPSYVKSKSYTRHR